jgi:hypothetical protein
MPYFTYIMKPNKIRMIEPGGCNYEKTIFNVLDLNNVIVN